MNKDIPLIDVIKADAMICVWTSDKSTQQDEDINKDQKQNDNKRDMVSSIEVFDMLRKCTLSHRNVNTRGVAYTENNF
jgi:hypothetical protein